MDPVFVRLFLVLALIGLVAAAGRWWRQRDGRVHAGASGAVLAADHLEAVGLDLRGRAAGALLLGSPTCTPCTAVKRVLGELADERHDFTWVYADAADHLDLAAAHQVMRVPTLLVVDTQGRVLARSSGVPAIDDLRRVLDHGGDLAQEDAA